MRNIKRKSKKWIGVVLCVLLFLCSSGCQKEETEPPVEIVLMHGWGGTLKTHKTMQEIYADFSRENPDIKLQCLPYSDSSIAVKKANDMLAVGKTPDILSTNGLSYYVRNAVKCNQAMDLMPYIEQDAEWKKQIHPAVFATWETSGGKLYTIPDALEVSGYWYNEEYFIKAGIVDEMGVVILPKTWTEFIVTLEKLKVWMNQEGGDLSPVALDNLQVSEFLFLARLAGEGKNGSQSAKNSYVKIEEATLKDTVYDIQKIREYSKDVENMEDGRQNFMDGNSAIYFNGVWESELLEDSPWKENIKYANYPTCDGSSLSYVSASSGYIVGKQTNEKKKEACIRFLKYMLSEKVQMKMAIETGQAPSNPNINRTVLQREYPMFGNAIDTAYRAKYQISTMASVWPEEEIKIVNRYILSKDSSNVEVKDMLEELNH